jgi:hypothetical protein
MIHETLKWPQIAPFCFSSKTKIQGVGWWGQTQTHSFSKMMACTLLSLSYAPEIAHLKLKIEEHEPHKNLSFKIMGRVRLTIF